MSQADCDSIRIYLQTSSDGNTWADAPGPQITISLEDISNFGHDREQVEVKIFGPDSALAKKKAGSPPSQPLAWVIRQPRILSLSSVASNGVPKFQSQPGYRLQKVEVWGPQGDGKLTLKNRGLFTFGDGCGVFQITADDTGVNRDIVNPCGANQRKK